MNWKQLLSFTFGLILAASFVQAQPIDVEFEPPFKPEGEPLNGLIITLDPGHGGSSTQPGYAGSARGTNSRVVEGDLNIRVALTLYHFLKDAGAEVILTRRDDRKVTLGNTGRAEELGSRVDMAEQSTSHLFLSLHHNSAARETADGVVILIWPTDSNGNKQPLETAFADILKKEAKKHVHWTEDFGHYIFEHPLVMDSDIPSAVIEFGFLSNPEFDAWVAEGTRHTVEAEAVYQAVVKMWSQHREELEAKRKELFPGAPEVESAERPSEIERYAKQLWPFPAAPETAEQANHLVELYKKTVLNDSTFFYLDARVEDTEDGLHLSGAVNHEVTARAVEDLLKAAGVNLAGADLRVLPSDDLGEKIHGVVQIPMALTWGDPEEGASVQTQLVLGDTVWLLDKNDEETYYLVHGADGYIGWVRREAIRRFSEQEFEEWRSAPQAILTTDIHIDDFLMPVGSSLPVKTNGNATTVTLRLPQGVRATDRREEADVPRDILRFLGNSAGREAALAAAELLEAPYLFGGRTSHGLDCSGLTGISYAAAGLVLPRDARQQILVGELVATPWHREGLQPGDLLFFAFESGRVGHTGISLGGNRFIHASPPYVQISSLDTEDQLYSEKWSEAFAFARRPLP